MRKICDFFGVTESELLYDPPRFAELFSLRKGSTFKYPTARPLRQVETLFRESGSLQRYVGCYYRYFYAFSHPGKIIKSFSTLSADQGKYFWKNIEIIDEGRGGRTVAKYEGAAFLLGERLHIIEHETLMATSITQLLLYPTYQTRIDYLVGTMIELPRAIIRADSIAEAAEFFSFGTNDLTQTVYGISRDDAANFLSTYVRQGILDRDPFQTIDVEGVGEMIALACEKARRTKPDISLGVCGEQGGDPASIAFFEETGLDYVSCSPYRVPIARLAAAQSAIRLSRAGRARGRR